MAEKVLKKFQGFSIDNKKINKYKIKKNSKAFVLSLLKFILLFGICFIILYPILMMFSKAFMDKADVFDQSVLFIPKHFTLFNFKIANILLEYPKSLTNSMLLAAATTVLQIISCLMAGYAFGRYQSKFKNILFILVVASIIVPPQLVTLPMFMTFKNFDFFGILSLFGAKPVNLIDTVFPYLILSATASACKNGIFIFMFRQFFRNMPVQIEEAAMVDGAGHMKTFFQVMLPNAVTSIVTVGLFSFVWQYNDIVYARNFTMNMKLLPTGYINLERFHLNPITSAMLGATSSENALIANYYPISKSAGTLLIMAPIMLIFLFFQRYFVESVERSGLTGM